VRLSSTGNSALTVLAYLSGIVLAVLASLQAEVRAVEVVAVAFVLVASVLFLPGFWDWSREAPARARLRHRRHLRSLTAEETDHHPSTLPNGIYGYEEIFAMNGLRGDLARLKPKPLAPDGHSYPIEVHRFEDDTYVVGWVSPHDVQSLARQDASRIVLWMRRRRKKVAGSLVEVPLSRVITDGTSLGDGSRRNGSRLELDLGATLDANCARLVAPTPAPALHRSPVSRVEIEMHRDGTTSIIVTGNIADSSVGTRDLAHGKAKHKK
jgi:hypothetical protein